MRDAIILYSDCSNFSHGRSETNLYSQVRSLDNWREQLVFLCLCLSVISYLTGEKELFTRFSVVDRDIFFMKSEPNFLKLKKRKSRYLYLVVSHLEISTYTRPGYLHPCGSTRELRFSFCCDAQRLHMISGFTTLEKKLKNKCFMKRKHNWPELDKFTLLSLSLLQLT